MNKKIELIIYNHSSTPKTIGLEPSGAYFDLAAEDQTKLNLSFTESEEVSVFIQIENEYLIVSNEIDSRE